MAPTDHPTPPPPVPDPNLADLRIDYTLAALREEDLAPDPFSQFGLWFNQACQANLLEPNAMTVATVDDSGCPAVRTVLLKHWDHRGFVFFTNLESRKAGHLAANPNVALLFAWLPLQRQLAIRGTAERTSTAEVLAYFAKRPFGSQLAAWASPQSRIISTRALLEAKWEELKRKFREGQVPLPSFWGGFRVVPRDFEFWQGGASRLHDRFLYSRTSPGTWRIDRLAP
ncbi:MAG: pyridoxamine 5'-phosphate oxidase [Verrucomicrobiae bacterium]|nr:pyridoxamine 5'-phosphate oxidase [Verrucomicrobiae bacterium]